MSGVNFQFQNAKCKIESEIRNLKSEMFLVFDFVFEVVHTLRAFPFLEFVMGLFDDAHGLFDGINRVEAFHLLGVQETAFHRPLLDPFQIIVPHVAEQDDRDVADMVHLNQLPAVDELQHGAHAARRHDHGVREVHELVQTLGETMKLLLDVQMFVGDLGLRELDRQPHRMRM